eukprot:5103197-Amphidinium_carterae.1
MGAGKQFYKDVELVRRSKSSQTRSRKRHRCYAHVFLLFTMGTHNTVLLAPLVPLRWREGPAPQHADAADVIQCSRS